MGHVPFSVGLSGALAMDQDSIEHLTGYLNALRVTPISGQTADLQASLPYREDLQHAKIEMPSDSLLDGGFIAIKIVIAERLQQLNVGETVNFVVKEFDFGIFVKKGIDFMDNEWTVRRDPDINGNLNFAIQMQWQYQKGTAKLIIDRNGIPVSFERGSRGFRRK